jgi:UDP-glucose 4-epimerase
MREIHAVLHRATLHKPHLATQARQNFVDTKIAGTLNLLEQAAAAGVRGLRHRDGISFAGWSGCVCF